MLNRKSTWEVVETDVLVIGAGFGGLWAALRAAELGAGVVLVDKSFAGKCGHSYFAGGSMVVMLPGDDPKACLHDIVLGNDWIVEQDMAAAVLAESYDRLRDLESFGISFRRSGGQYVWTRARGTRQIRNLWPERATGADITTLLRKVALARGVRVLDHVYVHDLVPDGAGGIGGAVALGVKEPRHYLLHAGSVVLATNTGGYRGHHLASDLQGTGPFMAYEAGARLKNPEFHYINIRPAKHEIEGSGILPAVGARWVNAKGEHYMAAYDPELEDRSQVSRIVRAGAREVMKGNGPVGIDVAALSEEERETFRILQVSHGWMPILFEKCRREEGYDPLRDIIEWQPAYETNKLGIDADIDCRTALKGLFAAGMARTLGINPFTGWSIAASTWSGHRAGGSAARQARDEPRPPIHYPSAMVARDRFFAPLGQPPSGAGLDPDDLVHELQRILFPLDVLIIMSEERLQAALERVRALKVDQLPRLQAGDTRALVKVRETQTMVLSAEMTLQAAIMRRETRENIFYRADYPEPDNAGWLKWIIAQKGSDGEIDLRTEDIPFEKYRFKPER